MAAAQWRNWASNSIAADQIRSNRAARLPAGRLPGATALAARRPQSQALSAQPLATTMIGAAPKRQPGRLGASLRLARVLHRRVCSAIGERERGHFFAQGAKLDRDK